MPLDPAVPRALEIRFAYATAVVASFAWVACVMPGARLADSSLADDFATPMHRGALYLVPALFLLVAVPVAAVIARHAIALRGLLAWSAAFVTFYAAAVTAATMHGAFAWTAAGALVVLGVVAVRDALRIGRAGSSEPPADLSPRVVDLRLALSLLVLVTPAGLLAVDGEERATLLVPFVFVAIGAVGERYALGLRGLRLATTLSLVLVAGHLVVGVRFALNEALPASVAWTAWGAVAVALSALVLALVLAWTATLAAQILRARAAEAAGSAGPAKASS